MVSIKNVLFFASGALALAVPRDISTILNDLANIDTKLKAVEAALVNYEGLPTAAPVDGALFDLNTAINDATTDANNAAMASESEGQQVIDYVNNTLYPDVKATVDELLVKAPIFKQNGEGFFAYLYAANLKNEANNYAKALLSKAPADEQTAGQAALQAVIDQINRAVNAFP